MTRVTYLMVFVALILGVLLALLLFVKIDDGTTSVDTTIVRPVAAEERATTTTSTTAAPTTTTQLLVKKRATPATSTAGVAWDRLADCESGEWDRDGNPIPGTARWDDNRGGYEGGVHFDPGTWDAYRDPDMPAAAYLATREQQIVVAERVLAAQGPGAWPVCSYKAGMR